MLKLKRAYDPVSKSDGRRFLVERLWPRGLSKARLHGEEWLKEVAPSTELRQCSATSRTSGRSFACGTSESSTRAQSHGALSWPDAAR